LKKLLLNLYFWPAFIVVTLVGLVFLPVILLINFVCYKRGPAKALRLAIRFYGWILVCLVPFMSPVRVVGNISNIPTPSILVANHNSAIDPYLFGAIAIENCFLTSWPFKIPLYGPLMKLAGYINTNDGWEKIRSQCAARLAEGSCVTIWPEGHRSRNGLMGRFRKGAFQLAVETGFPIQPICIFGSADILPPGQRFLSPGKAQLVLLDPLLPEKNGQDPQVAVTELRSNTMRAIQNCLNDSRNHDTGAPYLPKAVDKTVKSTINRPTTSASFSRQPHDLC
jgi:1-acyl-sn-glycerol-3-phosphate acyltransferase